MFTLFINILVLFVFLLASSMIGNGILKSFFTESKFNKHEKVFFNLLTGIIFISFLAGIIISFGVTMQWLLFIVGIFILVEKKISKSPIEFKINWKSFTEIQIPSLGCLLGGILIIFGWQLITHYESVFNASIVPYKDLIFYADVSQYMMQNGQENQFLFANEWFSSLNGIAPYHHFELWINGIAGKISGNYLFSMIFITNSLFLTLSWLGFVAVASNIRANENNTNYLIGIAGLWLTGFNYGIISEEGIWKYGDAITNSPAIIIFQKTSVLLPFFLASWVLWLRNEMMLARIVLLFLPIVSVATAPAVLLSIGAISLSDLIGKNKNVNHFLSTLFYLFSFTFIYFLLVKLFASEAIGSMGINPSEMSVVLQKKYIADFIYLIQTIPFIHFVAAIPWITLLFLIHYKSLKSLLHKTNLVKFLMLVIFWFAAFLSWQLFNYQGTDAIQFFNLVSGILLSLTFFLILVKSISSPIFTKIFSVLLIVGGITYAFWHNHKNNHFIKYDSYYVENVLKENEKLNNPNKAFILSINDYKETSDYHPYFKRAAWFLSLESQPDVILNIGIEHLANQKDWNLYQKSQWETSAFNLFSKEYRKKKSKGDWIQCQLAFIDKFDIKILFLGKGMKIPVWIENNIKKKYFDPISGETCIILKK
jgi:hypothetical protein